MKKFSFAIVATALLSTPIAAQQGPGARLSEACRNEVKALCGSAKDRDARRACMKENGSKVSESCRAELKTAIEARRGAKARPEGDGQ